MDLSFFLAAQPLTSLPVTEEIPTLLSPGETQGVPAPMPTRESENIKNSLSGGA